MLSLKKPFFKEMVVVVNAADEAKVSSSKNLRRKAAIARVLAEEDLV
jgi:formylmethanofuran dehydrogenase subunit D